MFKYLFTKHVSNVLEMFNESDERWFLLLGRHQETSLYKSTTKSLLSRQQNFQYFNQSED